MAHPRSVASAVAAAAASPVPGASPPVLDAWLLVRRRAFLTFPKRRHVVLTQDHVLLIDTTPVLHLVESQIASNSSSRVIDITPAPNCGIAYRLFADTPFQYSKWRAALQACASTSIRRFYSIDRTSLIGVGVHGIVRRAYPQLTFREDSLASSTSMSDYSLPAHNNIPSMSVPRYMHKSPSANFNHHTTQISPSHSPTLSQSIHNHLPSNSSSPPPNNNIPHPRFMRNSSHTQPPSIPSHSPSITNASPLSVAVKTVSRTGDGTVAVASEILLAKAHLHHFAIVTVLDVFETVNEIHVVMEECMGGSLTQYVRANGPLQHSHARSLFSPLLKAAGYMHASGIVHWDICPDNVLFLHPDLPLEPKLIDFSTARPISPATGRVSPEHSIFFEKGKVSSLACASPELLTSKAHRYAAKADMWQLGCVLYFLLVGKLPFSNRFPQDGSVAKTILTFCKLRGPDRYDFLFSEPYIGDDMVLKNSAKELIMRLLCPNPRLRPNALQCLREHAFLTSP